jgi:TonB family protein
MFRCVQILSLLVSSSMAAAASPLQPSDKWDVDYGYTQCTAARAFSTASGPVVLGIVPSLSGATFQLLVSVQRAAPKSATEWDGRVNFGRGQIKTRALSYGDKGANMHVYQYRVSADQMEQARAASAVSLGSGDSEHYEFALSDMPALLDGLRNCTVDLQRYWNMGDTHLSVAEAPERDIRAYFTYDDYPLAAVRMGQQGTAQYQLLIDEKGAIASCEVFVPSGVVSLDITGCEVIKERAKFTPARDEHGTPVRSVYTTPPISWRLSG